MNNEVNKTTTMELKLEFDDGYFVSARNGNEFLYFASSKLSALSEQSPELQVFLEECFEKMVAGVFGETDGEELMLHKVNINEGKPIVSQYKTNLVPEGAVVCYLQEPDNDCYDAPRDYNVMLPSEYAIWKLF